MEQSKSALSRSRIINKVSVIDTIANLLLGIVKIFLFIVSGSIAIASDSVLNLGDTVSGLLSIIGNKLTLRKPTEKHPFGFGRIEYITTILVSTVMITVGFEFGRIAINHIEHPVDVNLNTPECLVLVCLVFVKYFLYRYNKVQGEKTECGSLISFAHDSLIDCVGTGLTVTLIIIDHFVKSVNLDGWISLGVAAFIIGSCIIDIVSTASTMVGKEPSKELIEEIKQTAEQVAPIEGVRNILIHSYGYNVKYGQMDLELPDNMDIRQASKVLLKLEEELENKYNISFTFGIWPDNLSYSDKIHEYRYINKGLTISKHKEM